MSDDFARLPTQVHKHLFLGPRLARQPDQHLAQLARAGDPFREIQPQRGRTGLQIQPVRVAAGQLQSAASAPRSRVA